MIDVHPRCTPAVLGTVVEHGPADAHFVVAGRWTPDRIERAAPPSTVRLGAEQLVFDPAELSAVLDPPRVDVEPLGA